MKVPHVQSRNSLENDASCLCNFTGNKSLELTKFGFNVLKVAAPNHYLSMIKHAEYVLSASFHGTAFSINFQKQFYVVRGKRMAN